MKRLLKLKLPLVAVIQTEHGLQLATIPEKTPIAIIEDVPPSEVRVAWGTNNGIVVRAELEESIDAAAKKMTPTQGTGVGIEIDDLCVYGRKGRYSKVLRVLLDHGQFFVRGTPLWRPGGWQREAHACFRNAYLSVSADSQQYLYCEGFCCSSTSQLWFPHGWVTDCTSRDVAFDTTLPPDSESRHFTYFGVAISIKAVFETMEAEKSQCSVLEYWEKALTESEIVARIDAPKKGAKPCARGTDNRT